MSTTSRPAGALLSIALLFLALAVMAAIAVTPFAYLGGLETTIAQNQEALAKLRSEIMKEGELRKENSDLAARSQDASLLLEGDKTGIAGANLQRILSGVVAEHGGTASSFQVLPPKEDGNLMRIPVGLSISVGIDGLRDILHSLETGTPLIFVDDIVIRSAQEDFGAPDPHYLGPLEVTLQVSAFASHSGGH